MKEPLSEEQLREYFQLASTPHQEEEAPLVVEQPTIGLSSLPEKPGAGAELFSLYVDSTGQMYKIPPSVEESGSAWLMLWREQDSGHKELNNNAFIGFEKFQQSGNAQFIQVKNNPLTTPETYTYTEITLLGGYSYSLRSSLGVINTKANKSPTLGYRWAKTENSSYFYGLNGYCRLQDASADEDLTSVEAFAIVNIPPGGSEKFGVYITEEESGAKNKIAKWSNASVQLIGAYTKEVVTERLTIPT